MQDRKQQMENSEESKHRSFKYVDKKNMPSGLGGYKDFQDKMNRHHSSHLSKWE
jgi:hypothetical protein